MELKDITVDLEIAKVLKEKGFKQDGLFLWDRSVMASGLDVFPTVDYDDDGIKDCFIAPTTDELLAELPRSFNKKYLGIAPDLNNNDYGVYYMTSSGDAEPMQIDKKLPNALAKMWIYLKDNGLLK